MNSYKFYLPFFIGHDNNLGRVAFVQYFTFWFKCILAMAYNKISNNACTHRMMVFEIWIIMVINEVLLNIFNYSSFNSGDINLKRVIFIQSLTTWFKFTLARIYNQFSKTAFTQKIIAFESWIKLILMKPCELSLLFPLLLV